jgi:hypothetical protein
LVRPVIDTLKVGTVRINQGNTLIADIDLLAGSQTNLPLPVGYYDLTAQFLNTVGAQSIWHETLAIYSGKTSVWDLSKVDGKDFFGDPGKPNITWRLDVGHDPSFLTTIQEVDPDAIVVFELEDQNYHYHTVNYYLDGTKVQSGDSLLYTIRTITLEPGSHELSVVVFGQDNIPRSASVRFKVLIRQHATQNQLLLTLKDAQILNVKYAADNEVYIIYADSSSREGQYHLARWNGEALIELDTHPTEGQINLPLIAYKNSREYWAVYNQRGNGYYSAYNRPTTIKRFVDDVICAETIIPWQFGTMEGSFQSAIYYENRIFLVGNSRDAPAKVITVEPNTLEYSTVYTRDAIVSSGWFESRLFLVNNTLYFSYCQNTSIWTSPVLITIATWNGTGFDELVNAQGPSISSYGVQPYVDAIRDNSQFFLVTNGNYMSNPEVRLDKMDILNPTSLDTTNINNLSYAQGRISIVSADDTGHWRLKMNLLNKTYDLSRFDYQRDDIIASVVGLPCGVVGDILDENVNNHYCGDGGPDRLVYSVMREKDCELWQIHL